MKALVGAFNQEKALVGAFSMITNLRMELFQALVLNVVPYSTNFEHCQTPPPCLGWPAGPGRCCDRTGGVCCCSRRLHDVVQRCWSQSLLYTVTASTAASRINSVLCLYHILYVKFWYTLYVTIIMYWTITHSRKNGRFAFEFIALFIALHCR